MDSNSTWSLNLGRWIGIPVRFHVLLILFVAFIFSVDSVAFPAGLLLTAAVTTLVLLASIVIHELAHVFAVHNIGGSAKEIVLMPWGGCSRFELPNKNSFRILVYLAGPLVNFTIFLFGAALLLQTDQGSLTELIHPLKPHRFSGSLVSFIEIATWINFQLALVNLIPCFPFDGAQLTRHLFSAVGQDKPRIRVEASVQVLGTAVALSFIGLSWLLRSHQVGPVEPIWFFFFSGGIALYFGARYSFQENTREDSDWHEPATSGNRLSDSWSDSSFFGFGENEEPEYSSWLIEKQETRMRNEMELEQREIEMADRVLEKLHREGQESLSVEERRLLQRVSERLRRKRKLDVID